MSDEWTNALIEVCIPLDDVTLPVETAGPKDSPDKRENALCTAMETVAEALNKAGLEGDFVLSGRLEDMNDADPAGSTGEER